ncbi:hypothetical protein [Flagellimonas sp. CMM7]|uniref:hypothetical protein n=1 Tax=Flagellimonas sp. CMM7 TaxID=2654676 RepID=UPI001F1F3D20|nr:hypothetical protein [Flagellimonas sp. CMM7]UII81319.1 hypothetical protein LV704_07320 [Flagellimonas sp. CMM7]
MKEILRRCFAFLLIGLLLIKVSAFHVYEHQNNLDNPLEHCEHCLLAFDGQQFEGLIPSNPVPQKFLTPVISKQKIVSSKFSFTNTAKLVSLFSRPPPSQMV